MKRILTVIVFLAIVLAVAPQVQAQDMAKLQALTTELEQIQARASARGGSFTPQEVQRMNEIQNEIMQAAGGFGGMGGMSPMEQQYNQMGQQLEQQAQRAEAAAQQRPQQQPQQQGPQRVNGWPTANILSEFGIAGIPQSLVRGNPSYIRNPPDEDVVNEIKPARSVLDIRFEWANIDTVNDWFIRNGWTREKNYAAWKVYKKGNFTALISIGDASSTLAIGIR